MDPKDLFYKQTKKRRGHIQLRQEIMNKVFKRIKAGLMVSGALAEKKKKKKSLIIR